MTSASRMGHLLYDGCLDAYPPSPVPSRNGKNASEAITLFDVEAFTSLALSAGRDTVEYTRDICPGAHAIAHPSREHDCVDFTCIAHAPG
jgi:hypothetical protein